MAEFRISVTPGSRCRDRTVHKLEPGGRKYSGFWYKCWLCGFLPHQKFIKLCNCDLSTFLYVCCTSIKIQIFFKKFSTLPPSTALCLTHNIYCSQLTLLHGTAHQSLGFLNYLILKNRLFSWFILSDSASWNFSFSFSKY